METQGRFFISENTIMYLSPRSRNAAIIVIDLMRFSKGSDLSDIAQRQELRDVYTRKILALLVRAGIAKKVRRKFYLGKPVDQFTFVAIRRAMKL